MRPFPVEPRERTASRCTGSDDAAFYDAPVVTGPGHPGDLIRSEMIVQKSNANRTVYRVMYRTADSAGRPIAATGLVIFPTTPVPAGGWPVLSWGHGATGMAAACAPSRMLAFPMGFGLSGVIVGADYPGLGPNGQLHAYMSGVGEGRSMIDIVRAARNLKPDAVSRRWVSVGASQGGHAALFAGEVAAREARDLDLVGVVVFAPSSEATRKFPGDNPMMSQAVAAMSLYGRAVDHPALDPAQYATPALAAWSASLSRVCLQDAFLSFAPLATKPLWRADPTTTEPARSIWLANDPARAKTGKPILIIQGEADDVVAPARTRALIERECALGEHVETVFLPGGAHYDGPRRAQPQVLTWINDRLAGGPAASSQCPAPP